MTQTNRSHPAPACNAISVFLALVIMAALLAACNTSVGVGAGTGTTRVGGSVGSSGSVVGIGTSMGPSVAVSSSGNVLYNGPSEVRDAHRAALKNLKKGDYAAAESVFRETLSKYPAHPDATYFLGVTRIYEGARDDGFAILKTFRDPNYFRMTNEVQRTAAFLEQKPDLPAETVHQTLNRNRADGYKRDERERREMITW